MAKLFPFPLPAGTVDAALLLLARDRIVLRLTVPVAAPWWWWCFMVPLTLRLIVLAALLALRRRLWRSSKVEYAPAGPVDTPPLRAASSSEMFSSKRCCLA